MKAHGWRTAANTCGYCLHLIQPHMRILDVGCGPGSITVGLAALVPEGKVIGIEPTEEPLKIARELAAEQGVENVEFLEGDLHQLAFPDDYFDIVHVHQVLIHVGNLRNPLSELRRVTKQGGYVAVREADFDMMTWFPEDPEVLFWREFSKSTIREAGGEPNLGRQLHYWAHGAGFDWDDISVSVGPTLYATREELDFISATTSDRMRLRAEKTSDATLADKLLRSADAWQHWAKTEGAWYLIVNGQIICKKK